MSRSLANSAPRAPRVGQAKQRRVSWGVGTSCAPARNTACAPSRAVSLARQPSCPALKYQLPSGPRKFPTNRQREKWGGVGWGRGALVAGAGRQMCTFGTAGGVPATVGVTTCTEEPETGAAGRTRAAAGRAGGDEGGVGSSLIGATGTVCRVASVKPSSVTPYFRSSTSVWSLATSAGYA
jgi:hypothetical protein